MTMPTFDTGPDEDGGRVQHYAGRELLRQMKRRNISIPAVVITMFDSFGEKESAMTMDELHEQLMKDFEDIYYGMIFYTSSQDRWKDLLKEIMAHIENKKDNS
jgi:hypothetical protein